MGQPDHAALLAVRLGETLRLSHADLVDTYYRYFVDTGWLGGRLGEPSADFLRKEICKQFCILDEREFAPWVLRNSDRYYQLYFCHHVVARKITREHSPSQSGAASDREVIGGSR
jgi:hypothetical protein